MRHTDIAIIGGGLAGATAAAMLGRAGVAAIMVDPHRSYPPDFRIEKLGGDGQIGRLRKTGLADAVLGKATHDGVNWIARSGYLLDKAPSQQFGIMYDTLVNTIRAEIPATAETIIAKAVSISTSADRQQITLSNGETISSRLAVIANGLNIGLRQALGIERRLESPCHSISIGFNVEPRGRLAFPFPAMTYFSERPSDRIPYITLFPVGNTMRANLFVYRELNDPWLREFRRAPIETLNASLPRLQRVMGEFAISGDIGIRPVDLYANTGYRQAGIVLVGDAFRTTCPVAGTGTDKVFTDVERLCNVHIPAWLASEGMSEDKIAAFYDDPIKQACDDWAVAKAYTYRAVSVDDSIRWRAQRWARFIIWLGRGLWRRLASPLRRGGRAGPHCASSSSSSSSSSSASSSSSLSASA
jgi:2-polyprenyl-6-methoxyphenol hydroxylase-like FAD-dependent oxidoreductase